MSKNSDDADDDQGVGEGDKEALEHCRQRVCFVSGERPKGVVTTAVGGGGTGFGRGKRSG